MIRQTLFAVSTEESRPIYNGALFECRDNSIRIVSVDGFRVAYRKESLDCVNKFYTVIPGKNLNEISKILENSDETIQFYRSGNQVIFSLENINIVSKVIDGEFLNYEVVLPKDFETIVNLNRVEFLSSLERTSLITSDEKRNQVKINF